MSLIKIISSVSRAVSRIEVEVSQRFSYQFFIVDSLENPPFFLDLYRDLLTKEDLNLHLVKYVTL